MEQGRAEEAAQHSAAQHKRRTSLTACAQLQRGIDGPTQRGRFFRRSNSSMRRSLGSCDGSGKEFSHAPPLLQLAPLRARVSSPAGSHSTSALAQARSDVIHAENQTHKDALEQLQDGGPDVLQQGDETATAAWWAAVDSGAMSVPTSVLRWARSHPQAPAVRTVDGKSHSYSELVADAWALAGALRNAGLERGARCALLVDRSYDTFVALLGTWLAGMAYVAVDTAYPCGGIAYIINDCGAECLVTNVDDGSDLIPPEWAGHVISMHNGKAAASSGGGDGAVCRPLGAPQPEDLACIFYTSGTSGRPKGVLIDHGAFVMAVSNIPTLPGFGPGDVFGQVSSACYPGHVADIWAPLSLGACVLLIPGAVLLDPVEFGALAARECIAGAILTPKILELYADTAPGALAPLKLVQFAGERVRLDAVLKLLHAAEQGTKLQHLYGCSEHCSIISGLEVVAGPGAADDLARSTASFRRMPVGHARPGVSIHVLDPIKLTPVPDGDVGEVYVSSRQVSSGYHNLLAETQQRFVELPMTGSDKGGGGACVRAYRTGDLGRWAPNGLGLDLLGRAEGDGMVKVNGYRVELGEIEAAAIEVAPGTQQVHAAVWRSFLVLYLAPAMVHPEEVKERLRDVLPAWMVPTFVECLSTLPLNVAGKVDTTMLPAPTVSAVEHRPSLKSMSPQTSCASTINADLEPTEMEAEILAMFADILQISVRHMHVLSSFTLLGGHSLLAMSLLSRLRERMQCPELQLVDLLDDDCPRHLAAVIDEYHAWASELADVATLEAEAAGLQALAVNEHHAGSRAEAGPPKSPTASSPTRVCSDLWSSGTSSPALISRHSSTTTSMSSLRRITSPARAAMILPPEVQMIAAGEPGETPVWVLPGGQGRPRVGLVVGKAMRRRPCYTLEMTAAAAAAATTHSDAPIQGLLDHFVRAVRAVQPDGPYIFAGNRLAFAMAATFEARGLAVSRVLIMDDNPLWFDRREVEKTATHREQYGWIGMFKYAVLTRVFMKGAGSFGKQVGGTQQAVASCEPPAEDGARTGVAAATPTAQAPLDPSACMEAELDAYEAKYNYVVATGGSPAKLVVDEVTRWLGAEEGARWSIGLSTLMPILLSQSRPPARRGVDVLSAPIVVIKARDSWTFARIQEIYDPDGTHNYSWGPFTSAGPPEVHVVDGSHYSMGYDPEGATQLARLMDSA